MIISTASHQWEIDLRWSRCRLDVQAACAEPLSTFPECEMQNDSEDRRAPILELPEGLIRRHDISTLLKAALEMKREAGTEKASAFLNASGVPDELISRVLQHGLVREQDQGH